MRAISEKLAVISKKIFLQGTVFGSHLLLSVAIHHLSQWIWRNPKFTVINNQCPFQVDIFQFCVRCENCKVFVILQYIVLLLNLEVLVIYLTSKNLSYLSHDLKYLELALVDANQHLLNLEQSKCVPIGRWLESKMTFDDLNIMIFWSSWNYVAASWGRDFMIPVCQY